VSATLVSCRSCQRPLLLVAELRPADLVRLEQHGRECHPHEHIEVRVLCGAKRYFRIVRAEGLAEPGRS
jgi:hypothetical protein